jgi:hypothetical protein
MKQQITAEAFPGSSKLKFNCLMEAFQSTQVLAAMPASFLKAAVFSLFTQVAFFTTSFRSFLEMNTFAFVSCDTASSALALFHHHMDVCSSKDFTRRRSRYREKWNKRHDSPCTQRP